jgi:hypothetical protein
LLARTGFYDIAITRVKEALPAGASLTHGTWRGRLSTVFAVVLAAVQGAPSVVATARRKP